VNPHPQVHLHQVAYLILHHHQFHHHHAFVFSVAAHPPIHLPCPLYPLALLQVAVHQVNHHLHLYAHHLLILFVIQVVHHHAPHQNVHHLLFLLAVA